MSCNTNFSLGIISIILIISITILIFYKNMKDENINIEHFNVTPNPLDDIVIDNNNKINTLMNQLLTISPTIGFSVDPLVNDNEFQKKVGDNVLLKTSTIRSKYLLNNNITKKNIDNLENTITDLENIIDSKKRKKLNNIKYNQIKSLNNGMEMSLVSTPNTIFKDQKTGKITDAYLVNVNNGCISVGATDYDVYKCNDKNPKQLFKMQHIINETDYANNIDRALPFDNVDKTAINYPFAMIKSTNNGECLTNNHGTLTVQPCYSFIAQRWIPL